MTIEASMGLVKVHSMTPLLTHIYLIGIPLNAIAGEILAHAFPPGRGIGGDVHFDDEERWDVISDSGNANFPWVALHEIGHALGLGHSSKPGSIMLPVEEEFNLNLKLHDDDIKGIQVIYLLLGCRS